MGFPKKKRETERERERERERKKNENIKGKIFTNTSGTDRQHAMPRELTKRPTID